ncbi:MAG: S1 family peptidase [Anaerolineae bacterium]|nr:S1 family peptidase [Anaerolineae bacterium]
MANGQDVFQAQAAVQDEFMSRENVVGVAVGFKEDKTATQGEVSVVVLVEQKKPLAALSARDVIPPNVDGVRTDVYEVGYLRAFATPRDRFRPTIPSGVSIGHYKITAGTLGTIVTDRISGEKLILSNNHVLANSNSAEIGDPILQPGPTDGGQNPADTVARLERFVRIRFPGDDDPGPLPPTPPGEGGCLLALVNLLNALSGLLGQEKQVAVVPKEQAQENPKVQAVDNMVDAAVAKPLDPNMFTGEIRNIGMVSGTKPAALGMGVRKSGRTTDFTTGTVTLVNATVNISYGSQSARFVNQVITTAMSQGGDSGSLIVDGTENKAVGLLFAGSTQATIFNPIDLVLNELQIDI